MKRLLLVILMMMLTVYALPLVTVGLGEGEPAEGQPDEHQTPDLPVQKTEGTPVVTPAATGTYDEKTQITLLANGQVETLSLHDYLCGVLAAEMPASFPEEALKAQALAARTYTLYKLRLYEMGMGLPESHKGAQMCDDYSHCKAYCDLSAQAPAMWGDQSQEYLDKLSQAVSATDGVVATYQGEPIAAVFHAASSEKTEAAVDVWGSDLPYLQSVESPGGESSQKYHGQVAISTADFKAKFLEKHPDADLSGEPDTWFKASNRSQAGGIVDVAVGGVRVKGTELRELLGLNSTNFTLAVSGGVMTFATTGYGHGVGMSQYGARELALEGMTYDEIIKWYYQGVDLTLKS